MVFLPYMDGNNQMSFLEHLEELRWRLVRSAISVLVVAIVLWFFQEWIMENVFFSMRNPEFITFHLICEHFGICVDPVNVDFQSIELTGQFSYALMMCIIGGIVLSFTRFGPS